MREAVFALRPTLGLAEDFFLVVRRRAMAGTAYHAGQVGTPTCGERRASSVKRYLVDLGVSSSKLRTVSYGEARPAVAGSGEGVWSRNRRAEFASQ